MANRIQLRRDTAVNWTRENPILSQGEPGYDLTANKLKVGDGVTAWTELDYASGSGANFDYSTLQEGLFVPFGGVTSITGNHDTNTGVGLTSESWAQLMWVPDTSVVTVDEISDGANVYNWAYVDDQGFFITNHVNTATHQWKFNTSGHLTLPSGGLIKNSDGSTYGGGGSVGDRLTAGTTATLVLLDDGTLKLTHPTEWWSGAYSLEIQKAAGNYHTFKSAYGLSLQATPVPNGYGLNTNTNFVDIFHDGVSVNVNDNTWGFGTDGKLTLPAGGAFTSPDYNFSFNSNGGDGVPTLGTVVTSEGGNDIGEIFMGSGYGEFRSIYNSDQIGSTSSGLVYAGVEGFNYAQYGDVNFSGIVSQTPHIDSMYTVGVNTLSQITIGFTQNGQKQQSTDWSVAVGSLTTDYTVNGLFADTTQTVISGSQEIKLTTNRGTVLFGNQPEQCEPLTLSSHFHIMKKDPGLVDLFFGDDFNYVKLPTTDGVEIGTFDGVNPPQQWQFGTDGNLTLPTGGQIKSAANTGTVVINTNDGATTSTWTFGTGGNLALPGDLVLLANHEVTRAGGQKAVFKVGGSGLSMVPEGGGLVTASYAYFSIRTVNNNDGTYTITFVSSRPTAYSWSGFGMDMSTGTPINVWGAKFTATIDLDYTIGTLETIGDTFQIILNDYATGHLHRITVVLVGTSPASSTISIELIA